MEKIKNKVRFTSFDIAAIVVELKKIIGLRLKNIYNVGPTIYLFKFFGGSNKATLLVQNGIRFHLTESAIQKNKIPSGFTMKFRKFLRSKKLTNVLQVGMQRVVVFSFGSQQFQNHLIFELYSQGNIILTDKDYKIIQLMRKHQFSENFKTAIGQIYPFQQAANIYLQKIDLSKQKIQSILQEMSKKGEKDDDQKKKKKKDKSNFTLRDFIQKSVPCLFPQAIDLVITNKGMNPNQLLNHDLQILKQLSIEALRFTKEFKKKEHKGYLIFKKGSTNAYSQYSPIFFPKYKQMEYEQKDTFNEAVDCYYKNFKRDQKNEEFQQLAWKKYDQIKQDQEKRIAKLHQEQQIFIYKAILIEQNYQEVDAIIDIINKVMEQEKSKDQTARIILEAKKKGDPLANLIHELNLQDNQVSLLLSDPNQQEQLSSLIPVQVNLNYNSFMNAKKYYENKKKNANKEQRTKEASENVLKGAKKEAEKQIENRKKQIEKQQAVRQRKHAWFQKFYWFISSDHYLVICGKDIRQNQTIVKKYMSKKDIYVHADYGGAASIVIKNYPGGQVPKTTLQEAGIYAVCRSKSWETKIMSNAWWVHSIQVSKSAPTGQYLPTGSFMIRGKKNFIYPTRLELSVLLLYNLDSESLRKRIQKKQQIKQQEEQEYKIEEVQEMEMIKMEVQKKEKKGQKKGNKKNTKEKEVKKNENKNKSDAKKDNKKKEKEVDEKKELEKEKISQKVPLHKKHKLKKLKKYQDQSDQQRNIKMKLMGSKKTKDQIQSHQSQEQQDEQLFPKKSEPEQKLNKEEILFFHMNKPKKQQQQQEPHQQQPENQEDKEDKQNEHEKSEKEEEDDQKRDQSHDVLKLTSTLEPNEQFDSFTVMIAPFNTMSNRYPRIKITYGILKKGKAARNNLSEKEKNLIHMIPEQDIINQLVSNCKLTAAKCEKGYPLKKQNKQIQEQKQ